MQNLLALFILLRRLSTWRYAIEAIDSGLIPYRSIYLVFTASLLNAQLKGAVWITSRESLLVAQSGKTLNRTTPLKVW